MADKIKKFFAKKKMEAKFKMAGPGRRLTDSSSNCSSDTPSMQTRSREEVSEESRVAAAAALARVAHTRDTPAFNTSLAAIQAKVRKELEQERSGNTSEKPAPTQETQRERETTQNLAIGGVFFRCPMISNEVLPRDEWKPKIKEFLYSQLEEEPGLTAALIIHSCNSGREKIELCVNTLCKYLENVVSYPEEEKYKKIRMNNRVFSERVAGVEGSLELLQAAGFRQMALAGPDGEEQVLVFSEENVPSVDSLVMLMEALRTATPIPLELDRGVRVLLPSQAASERHLPAAFYSLTPDELKREQQARTEAVERGQMLRTKAMREKEEQREMKKYRFALVRVRFPDGILLQGTFSVYEKYEQIVDFVKEHLEHDSIPFTLTAPSGHKLSAEEDGPKSLLELKLVPTSVLMFSWSSSEERGGDVFLKPEVMLLVQEMN